MKVHIAVAVEDLDASVSEYTQIIGVAPVVVVRNEYALWRTQVLNFSIRCSAEPPGTVRHVGFERDDAPQFSEYRDKNGLLWETFSKLQQAQEINSTWPATHYEPG